MSKEEPFRQKVTPDCQELPFSLSWRFLKTNVTWSCFLYDFFFYIIFFFFFVIPIQICCSRSLIEVGPRPLRVELKVLKVRVFRFPTSWWRLWHPPLPLCCLFCPGAFNLMSLIYYWPPLASFLGESGIGIGFEIGIRTNLNLNLNLEAIPDCESEWKRNNAPFSSFILLLSVDPALCRSIGYYLMALSVFNRRTAEFCDCAAAGFTPSVLLVFFSFFLFPPSGCDVINTQRSLKPDPYLCICICLFVRIRMEHVLAPLVGHKLPLSWGKIPVD